MLGRLSILFVTAFFLNAAASADSISLQGNPNLATQRHALSATTRLGTLSQAVAGDLGRGFSIADRRSILNAKNPGPYGDRVLRGSLTSSDPGISFGTLGNTRSPRALDTFTDRIWRFLFHRAPTGARGRRELTDGSR